MERENLEELEKDGTVRYSLIIDARCFSSLNVYLYSRWSLDMSSINEA